MRKRNFVDVVDEFDLYQLVSRKSLVDLGFYLICIAVSADENDGIQCVGKSAQIFFLFSAEFFHFSSP